MSTRPLQKGVSEAPPLVQATPEHYAVMRKNVKHLKILTSEAQMTISNVLLHGLHSGKPDSYEPPYMPPSENPDDYSAVWNLFIDVSAPPDNFHFTSGVPSVGTLQRFFFSVWPVGLGYVSGPGTRQGGAWYGTRRCSVQDSSSTASSVPGGFSINSR